MSKALEMIQSTSTIEVEMMQLLSAKLDGMAIKSKSVATEEENGGKTKTLPNVWEFVYENARKIVSKSINKNSGASANLKDDWRHGEGESALFGVVAEYSTSFNNAFRQGGTSAVENLAVTSLKNAFIAFCKTESSGGIVKRTTKNEMLVGEKEYSEMSDDQKSQAVSERMKLFSTVSIHADDDDEEIRGIEIQADTLDPLSFLLAEEDHSAPNFDDIAEFVKSNPSRYPVLLDVFALHSGLMRQYTVTEIAKDAARLSNDFGVKFDISELINAVEGFKVLQGDLKINTVQKKLGIIETAPILEAIKAGTLTHADVLKARQIAFRNHAEINGLINGFHAGETVFFSIDDLVNAAIMQVAEGRSDNEDLAVVADLVCADPCRADDKAFQKAKREIMAQLFGGSPKEYDLPPMPPVMQLQEQIALF